MIKEGIKLFLIGCIAAIFCIIMIFFFHSLTMRFTLLEILLAAGKEFPYLIFFAIITIGGLFVLLNLDIIKHSHTVQIAKEEKE